MRLRKPKLALIAIALGGLALVSPAYAAHLRPKGATPLRDSLVIAQQPCTAANKTTHHPPPTVNSCTPAQGAFPSQTSAWLTVGTPDVSGVAANFIGFDLFQVAPNDINVISQLTDIRCLSGTSASVCGPANSAGGADYTGQLQMLIGLRITDHYNAATPGGPFTDPGTAVDFQFPVTISCASTASIAVGATCAVNTSFNAVVPGSAQTTKRTVYEIPQSQAGGGIQIFDGGQSGIAGSSGATLFAETGVFLP